MGRYGRRCGCCTFVLHVASSTQKQSCRMSHKIVQVLSPARVVRWYPQAPLLIDYGQTRQPGPLIR
jgi:hypothetical protein